MIWKFNRNGTEEEVTPEIWQWLAVYNDGTVLKQFDDVGVFHQVGEIDQSRLSVFRMVSNHFPQIYAVPFDPLSMKLVHGYLRTGLGVGTPQFREIKSYYFGYKTKNLSLNHQHLLVIVPEGEVIVCEDQNIINFE